MASAAASLARFAEAATAAAREAAAAAASSRGLAASSRGSRSDSSSEPDEDAALKEVLLRCVEEAGFVDARPLGQGSFGFAMRARRPDGEDLVLKAGVLSEAAAELSREAKNMAGLSHVNIARLYEFLNHEGHTFLAMDSRILV